MALFLDEDMVGSDAALIGFPHLVLCMGVVIVMGDGSLVGAHFTTSETEQRLLRLLGREASNNGSGMRQFYCMADLAKHDGMDIAGKAKAIGFAGQGYVADFGILKPTNGTYAQVVTTGADSRATVRCKLNELMQYAQAYRAGPAVSVAVNRTIPTSSGKPVYKSTTTTRNSDVVGAAVQHGQDMNTPYLSPVQIA